MLKSKIQNKILGIRPLILPLAFWSAYIYLACFLFGYHSYNSDEGVILAGAWDLLNGKRMYFDIFQFTPPGAYFLVAWAWQIFGPTYLVAKTISITAFIATAAGLYKITKSFLPERKFSPFLAPLALLIISLDWYILTYHIFNLAFLVWATYFFICGITKQDSRLVAISALLAGIGNLFLIHRTVFFLIITILFSLYYFWREKNRFWLNSILFYFFLSILSPILLLLAFWPAPLLYERLISFPFLNYTEVNKIGFGLFFMILAVTLVYSFSMRLAQDHIKKYLIGLQFFLLLSTYSRPDYYHVTIASFPLIALLPIYFQRSDPKYAIAKYIIKFFLVLLILGSTLFLLFSYVITRSISSEQGRKKLISIINEECGATPHIYAGPYIPHIYYETQKRNILPYSWLLTGLNPPAQFNESRRILEASPPQCAILYFPIVEKFGYNRNNPVDNFFYENYRAIDQLGDFIIMKKL